MWQRLQTLFLVIATGLVVAMFFSIKSFQLGPSQIHVDELKYVSFIPYLVLLIIATALQLIAIFTYNVRVFQLRTSILAALFLIALQAWIAVDFFTADDSYIFRFTAIFPILAAICDVFAARYILRDQLMVESITRLRSDKKKHRI